MFRECFLRVETFVRYILGEENDVNFAQRVRPQGTEETVQRVPGLCGAWEGSGWGCGSCFLVSITFALSVLLDIYVVSSSGPCLFAAVPGVVFCI